MEDLQQRANEGHPLPRSMGLSAPNKGAARAGARRLESPADPQCALRTLLSLAAEVAAPLEVGG